MEVSNPERERPELARFPDHVRDVEVVIRPLPKTSTNDRRQVANDETGDDEMLTGRVLAYAATALVMAGAPAQAEIVSFTANGAFADAPGPLAGTPLSVSFAWNTSVRPVPGRVESPFGPQVGPVYATNPLVGPVTFTGSFGTLSYADVPFSARFEPTETRLFLDYVVSPFPGPLRIASIRFSLPFISDPYGTDLPADLSGKSAFVTLVEPGVSDTISGATVVFAPSVSAVPEPATWAMMLIGFGTVGALVRRRKVRTTIVFVQPSRAVRG